MKISSLIQKLEEITTKFGDLEVCTEDGPLLHALVINEAGYEIWPDPDGRIEPDGTLEVFFE